VLNGVYRFREDHLKVCKVHFLSNLVLSFVGLIFLMQESVEAIHVSFARGKAGKGKDSKGDRGDKGDGRGDRKGDRKGDGKGKDPSVALMRFVLLFLQLDFEVW